MNKKRQMAADRKQQQKQRSAILVPAWETGRQQRRQKAVENYNKQQQPK